MSTHATWFIDQNKTLSSSKYINVCDNEGHVVGKISAPTLKTPDLGPKLYSFGAFSDIHVTKGTSSMAKFEKALKYMNEVEHVLFTCISGDLVGAGTKQQLLDYGEAVRLYSPDVPVYACTGNHDVENTAVAPLTSLDSTQRFYGQDLYYSFTQGSDVFIMFGMSAWPGKTGAIFTLEAINWLYQTLEKNRDKRCFVFEHCPHFGSVNGVVTYGNSGSVMGWPPPTGNLLSGSNTDTGASFRALMSHYHNVIWFHGHSHMEFQYQRFDSKLNYDYMFGCHSIHIPSLSQGREKNAAETGYIFTTEESTGYVVDVYEKHIVLRGRDFVADEFVPIATFCLDTTLQTIQPGTFSDPAGNIRV